jgi:hypothetical protein
MLAMQALARTATKQSAPTVEPDDHLHLALRAAAMPFDLVVWLMARLRKGYYMVAGLAVMMALIVGGQTAFDWLLGMLACVVVVDVARWRVGLHPPGSVEPMFAWKLLCTLPLVAIVFLLMNPGAFIILPALGVGALLRSVTLGQWALLAIVGVSGGASAARHLRVHRRARTTG